MKPVSILFSLLLAISFSTNAADKPHIILVMADDQGWGDMAYNGHPVIKTPNFDKAAATGLRFDRFYAAAPVCSPTRASVMTGRHPNRMGVFKWGYPIRPQETTIAEALKTAGYTTAHFGKWHLGSVRHNSPVNPGRNGFDVWLSAPNFYDNDATLSHNGKAVKTRGESSMIIVDAAIDWMKKALKGEHPICAVVWFGSPHSPHAATEEFRKLYDDQPKNLQHFYGEITGMDAAYGKLRDSLTTLGIRDNTVFWYCSDNGGLPRVGSTGGRGNKGQVYEGGLLVPSILEWPAKIKAHRITDFRGNTCDIYPTLLEIVGVKMKNQPRLDGISLLPIIMGDSKARKERSMGFWDHSIRGLGVPSEKWMTTLYEAQQKGEDLEPDEPSAKAAELPNPPHPVDSFPGHSAWIDGDWKLHRIQDKAGKVKWEFYNLAVDPMEKRDLMALESQRTRHYRGRLETWLESVARSLNGEDYSNSQK